MPNEQPTVAPHVAKQLRKKYGLTQAELAEIIGVSRQTVINRERGYVPISRREYDYMKLKLAEGV